jgi:hypothetical protein
MKKRPSNASEFSARKTAFSTPETHDTDIMAHTITKHTDLDLNAARQLSILRIVDKSWLPKVQSICVSSQTRSDQSHANHEFHPGGACMGLEGCHAATLRAGGL